MFKAKFSAGHLGRSVSEEVGSAQQVEINEKRLTHIKEKNKREKIYDHKNQTANLR
jgi:hypothetical protein